MTNFFQLVLLTAINGLLFISCDSNLVAECFDVCCMHVHVSADDYQNSPDDELEVIDVQLEGDCLLITFSAGGCDGNSWKFKLIDSEEIKESNPPQRNLRLSLENEELCKAIVTKSIAYNVSSLRIDVDKIKLNITNSGDQILYEY